MADTAAVPFIGTYTMTMDAKNRIVIPPEHRAGLGDKSFYIARATNLKGVSVIFTQKRYEEICAEFERKLDILEGEDYQRCVMLKSYFFANLYSVTADEAWRIILNPDVRKYGGLTKRVSFVGALNRIELWDEAKREDYDYTLINGDEIIRASALVKSD